MFEHFNTPEEIFSFKLGSTLTAERDAVAVLERLASAAQHPELQQLLQQHVEETKHQAQNIEEAFRLLGEDEETAPAPTAKGLAKEGDASIRKTDDSIVDAVVIAAALENEHWEVAVYEVLVANAKARGAHDVARLLTENLDQEVATSRKLHALLEQYSQEGYAVQAAGGGATRSVGGTDRGDSVGVEAAKRAGA